MVVENGQQPTLSVIMPALNEEANITAAVRETVQAIGDRFREYELLLLNDGSQDQTGHIMDKLATENPRIRVAHNPRPRGLGGVYKQGLAMARFEYVIMVPGDNENPGSALIGLFDTLGSADIVIPFHTNPEARSLLRRAVSRAYTTLLNVLFGQRLKYYHGTVIHRCENLRTITINTDSFSYQSEALIKLLRAGKSCVEVGVEIHPRSRRRSKIFQWHNVVGVIKGILYLIFEVHFKGKVPL